MSTIREQIVAAAVTALNTARPTGVPAAIRTRLDSPSAAQLPALTVYQAAESVEPMHRERMGAAQRGPVVKRTLFLNVEVVTKAGATEEPDKAADPILAWAVKSVVGAGTMNGLANNAADEVGTKFEYDQSETSFCRATTTFRIEYQSRTSDAEQAA